MTDRPTGPATAGYYSTICGNGEWRTCILHAGHEGDHDRQYLAGWTIPDSEAWDQGAAAERARILAALPEALLTRIGERHKETEGPWPPEGHVCIECWQRWPCDAAALAAAIERVLGEER